MKRCLFVFAMISALILSFASCGNGKIEYIQKNFESTVLFTDEGRQYEGKLVYTNDKKVSFTLTAPETLKDSLFAFDGSEMTLSYDGITIAVAEDVPAAVLCKAVLDFSDKTHSVKDKGTQSIAGKMGESEYEIIFDCEEKKIAEIYVENTAYIFT